MNGFKKLVLSAAILAASGSAMALQAMDDDSLSTTTGQDGITLTVANSSISNLDITWVDRDGLGPTSGFPDAGAVVFNNLGLNLSGLTFVVDAGSSAADGAQLNIDISTTNNVVVTLAGLTRETIDVATATGVQGTATASAVAGNTAIVSFAPGASLTVTGGFNASLKLGNRAAGENFLTLATNPLTPFDVILSGVTLLDSEATAANLAGNDVGIGLGALAVRGVVLSTAVNVQDNGLAIDTTGTTIGNVALESIKLGDQVTQASLGDIYLSNMNASTQLVISGHVSP